MEYFSDWSKSDLTALFSFIVALSALLLAIWQGIAMKTHNVLSLRPIIRFATEVSVSKKGIALSLTNHGVGPAIITSLFYVVRGEKYEIKNANSFSELRSNIGLTDFDFRLSCHPKIKGAVITSGNETILFKFF